MPNYSDQQVQKRASSGGKDPGRMHTIDRLYQQATQPPHEDDAAAIGAIKSLSGVPGGSGLDQAGKPTEGFATADARNYGKMMLSRLDPSYTPSYDQANDGSFKPLHALGGIAKVAAPFAGMIPGVGIPLAAGLGALGNTAGNLMQGNGFDLKGALLSGAAGAAGSALTGGQGFKGLGGIPQRMGISGGLPAAPSPAAIQGAAAASGVAAPAASGGAGGVMGAIGNGISKLGGLGNVVKGGVAVGGFLDSRAQRHAAERMANARLGVNQQQLRMAEDEYNSRAPLRNAALTRLGALAAKPPVSSLYGGM